jgi:hypothetical protein
LSEGYFLLGSDEPSRHASHSERMRKSLPRHAPFGALGPQLTRREVAEVLGVSYHRVCGLQREKKLVGDRDAETGTYRFERAIVFKLAAERAERAIDGTKRGSVAELDGRLVARVFHYFSQNWTLAQIVMKEELPPAIVRGLYNEYCAPLGERSPPWHRARRGRPIIRSVPADAPKNEPIGSVMAALTAAVGGRLE